MKVQELILKLLKLSPSNPDVEVFVIVDDGLEEHYKEIEKIELEDGEIFIELK